MMWKCHVDEPAEGRYDMILGRDVLTSLGLDVKVSECVIIGIYGPYEKCLLPMVDISNYEFKSPTDKIFKPEESFI